MGFPGPPMRLTFSRHRSMLPSSGTQFATTLVGEWNEGGDTSIQLGNVTVPAGGYRHVWPWHRLFIWGGQSRFGFSETQRRSEQNDGNVGLLDAGVQAVPRWSFSPGWTDLVRRFPKCGSFMYGWSRLYGLRLTTFTGSRWPTGDTSIPALGLPVGWRSRSYS